ncbi:MAG: nucleotidyltransferase family protein [Solirubrobacteraceae bacterium]
MTEPASHEPLSLEDLRARRAAILAVARRHGALNVRVFGSAVRGDTHAASDVDFLVDMERGRSLLDLGALLMDLADLLDQDVDVVTEKGLRDRLRPRVLAEAQPL